MAAKANSRGSTGCDGLMVAALAASAPCIGVLFTAGLPPVTMAALTAMRLEPLQTI